MTDTDPEDEVRDVPTPANGIVQTPHTDTGGDGVVQREEPPSRHRERERQREQVLRRYLALDDAGNARRDVAHRRLAEDERFTKELLPFGEIDALVLVNDRHDVILTLVPYSINVRVLPSPLPDHGSIHERDRLLAAAR